MFDLDTEMATFGFTDATDLDLIIGAPRAKIWASLPMDPNALRLCPVCHERLPDGSNPYRIYCSERCRTTMHIRRQHGIPTLVTKRCGRCEECFRKLSPGGEVLGSVPDS